LRPAPVPAHQKLTEGGDRTGPLPPRSYGARRGAADRCTGYRRSTADEERQDQAGPRRYDRGARGVASETGTPKNLKRGRRLGVPVRVMGRRGRAVLIGSTPRQRACSLAASAARSVQSASGLSHVRTVCSLQNLVGRASLEHGLRRWSLRYIRSMSQAFCCIGRGTSGATAGHVHVALGCTSRVCRVRSSGDGEMT